MILPDKNTPAPPLPSLAHITLMKAFEDLGADLASSSAMLGTTRETLTKLKATPPASISPELQKLFASGLARNEALLKVMDEFIQKLEQVFEET